MNPLVAANLALLITVLSWGLPVPFFDSFFDRWDPVLSSSLRYWIAIPILYLLWRLSRAPGESLRPAGVGWLPIVRLSAFGLVFFSLCYSYAVDNMHPITAGVMSGTGPAVSAIVARVGFRMPLQRGFGIAILCSLVGTLLTAVDFSSTHSVPFEFRGGEPLFILSQALWAWYSLQAQRLFPGVPQMQLTLCTFFVPALLLPVIYLAALPLGLTMAPPLLADLQAQDVGIQLWTSLMGVGAAIVCWNYGVKHMGLVVASLYGNLVPICVILTALVIGVEPRPLQIVGGAIVLFGVIQAQVRLVRLRRAAAADALLQKALPP